MNWNCILERVAQTESTNDDLMARWRSRELIDPVSRLAKHQTKGKGRAGRQWFAEPNSSLSFSLAYPFNQPQQFLHGLSLVCGLAVALDLIYDRRKFDGENCIYDPLSKFLELFEGVEIKSTRQSRAAELAALPLTDRLVKRIIDGEKQGLEEDLQSARESGIAPLVIINDYLLEGMKVVGELFGKGEMQLPFVLQSAEVMKNAVALLEPYMEKSDSTDRGSILLATVKGDVHDIGKNLVDIILTND